MVNPNVLLYGFLIACLFCAGVGVQRWSWRRGPRTPAQAERRRILTTVMPYSQLGVRVGLDGFVYANVSGKPLGLAAGARAAVLPARPVHTMKPGVGWAVIYFADGETHHWMFATRNKTEAMAQAERFNGAHGQEPAGVFRRTSPRPGAAASH